VEDDHRHYQVVASRMRVGAVVPFLGAGINLCGREEDLRFDPGRWLPSGRELAEFLRRSFAMDGKSDDLINVAQRVSLELGSQVLYDELHRAFDFDYAPTDVHRFLAGLPGWLRSQGRAVHQLIVTTNYDDSLERAFYEIDEPVDVVTYIAKGKHIGKFLHRDPDGNDTLVEVPNEYKRLSLDERTVIAKMHGAVDRPDGGDDSFVITEDHYIDYLTHTDISQLIPVSLAARIRRSHFLFLGYSLRDWNMRVILHRLWGDDALTIQSWAVQREVDDLDRRWWGRRNVELRAVDLAGYVRRLQAELERPLEASA
jgi:hypothetical protein